MKKRLKASTRGLCFSTDNEELIGKPFRYIVDVENNQVLIIPNEGNSTISRKKCGSKFKPLFDLRSKEVRALISKASYMEVEEKESLIYVHIYEKFSVLKRAEDDIVICLEDVLARKSGEIVLKKAVNGNSVSYQGLKGDISFTNISSGADNQLQTVYDVVSLFSGAGLLDYSFIDPHFRFVYAVDFSQSACKSYRYNIGNHIVCKDIREVRNEEIPPCDVIIGGPCCQGYSNSNRRNIYSENAKSKRELIDEYIRITLSSSPKVFVIENVPQFMTMEQGRFFSKVIESMSKVYSIASAVINDSEVGGYSTRKRAIVIGSRIGKIEIPSTTLHTVKTVRDALSKVDASWFNFEDISTPSENTKKLMSYIPQGGNFKDIPKDVREFGKSTQSNVYRRLAWDEPSVALTNWRKSNLIHPEEDRILSVAEAAAIMGLDKRFRVYGTLNDRQQSIGNGVTQAIGKLCKDLVLRALKKEEKLCLIQTEL